MNSDVGLVQGCFVRLRGANLVVGAGMNVDVRLRKGQLQQEALNLPFTRICNCGFKMFYQMQMYKGRMLPASARLNRSRANMHVRAAIAPPPINPDPAVSPFYNIRHILHRTNNEILPQVIKKAFTAGRTKSNLKQVKT
jgi:hypothetical protein